VTPLRTPDVLVIGGGVIGCAIARELAPSRRVLVVDRGAIGGEASSAAAGVLGAASGDDDAARLELRRASRAEFDALGPALRDETGIDVGFVPCGVLALAGDEAEAAALDATAARRRAQGFDVETLDGAAVHALEPAASRSSLRAVRFPGDAVVVATRFVAALAESARRRGAVLVPGLPAIAVERTGARVTRVRVGDEWIAPGLVVLATGAWAASGVAGLDAGVDVVPVRGQMIALRAGAATTRHVLMRGSAFAVPRPDGEVWIGATFEEAGFVKAVTPEGLAALARHVEAVAPSLRAAPVVRSWCGLRPGMADGGPALGPSRTDENVLLALGHHRNGILLAPVTARTIAAYVEGIAPPAAAVPFAPRP
jgi:glycine oxidase